MSEENKYNVVLYHPVMVKVLGVMATSQVEACKKAEETVGKNGLLRDLINRQNPDPALAYIELDEDGVDDFLVDEAEDPEFKNSRYYDASYRQITGPAGRRAVLAREIAESLRDLMAAFKTALSVDAAGKDPDGFKYDVLVKAEEMLEQSKSYFCDLGNANSEPDTKTDRGKVWVVMTDTDDSQKVSVHGTKEKAEKDYVDEVNTFYEVELASYKEAFELQQEMVEKGSMKFISLSEEEVQ